MVSHSKKYTVDFSKAGDKALSKLDAFDKKILISWIEDKLEGCTDPRRYGKGLSGERSGQWRYRIGSFRVIADIQDDKVLVLIIDVGHRKKIYK